jgi:hypothetical protein
MLYAVAAQQLDTTQEGAWLLLSLDLSFGETQRVQRAAGADRAVVNHHVAASRCQAPLLTTRALRPIHRRYATSRGVATVALPFSKLQLPP